MATGTDSKKGLQTEDIADFLISKKLRSPSLILLDMIIPFKRPISAFLTAAQPLSSLLFGETAAEKILSFSRSEDSLSALRDALERGDE